MEDDIPAGASFEAQAWATLRLCNEVAAHEGGSLAALVGAEAAALLARPEAPLTAATDVYDVLRAITFLCGPGGGGRTRLGAYHTARFMDLGLQAERFVGKRQEETNAPQPPALTAREREGEAVELARLLEQAAGHALYAEAAESCARALAEFREPEPPGEACLVELRAKVRAAEMEKEELFRQRSRELEELRRQRQQSWQQQQGPWLNQHSIYFLTKVKAVVEKQKAIVPPSKFMAAVFDASAFDPHIFLLMRQQVMDPGLLERLLPMPTLDSLNMAAIRASQRLLGQPQLPEWQKDRLERVLAFFMRQRQGQYLDQDFIARQAADTEQNLLEEARKDIQQLQQIQQQEYQKRMTPGMYNQIGNGIYYEQLRQQVKDNEFRDQIDQLSLLLGRFQDEERGLTPEQRLDIAALPRFSRELGRLQVDISALRATKTELQRLREALQALPPEQLLQRQSEAELDAVFAQMMQLEPRLLVLEAQQQKLLDMCTESGRPGRGSMLDRIYGYHRNRCEAFFNAYFSAVARNRATYRLGNAHHGVRLKLAQLHELQNVRAVAAPAPHARAAVAAPALRGSGGPTDGAAASLLAVVDCQRARVMHSSEADLLVPVIARAQANLNVAMTRFNAQQAVNSAESARGEAVAGAALARGEAVAAAAERDAARASLALAEAALALSSPDAARRDAALKALPGPKLDAHAAQLRIALEAADALIAARKRDAAEAAAAEAARAAAEAKLCVVCIAAPKDTALVPCGHKCVCGPCAAKLRPQLCPICRAPIASAVKVFES